jgi:hypothetical protein
LIFAKPLDLSYNLGPAAGPILDRAGRTYPGATKWRA